jgi:uncharacterized repeat protein (TIGR03843 family)
MVTADNSETSAKVNSLRLTEEMLTSGEIELVGRLVDASNATLFAKLKFENHEYPIVYKPIAGERPLWDFPDGNLASREVAAYEFSKILGFQFVPITVLRDGPFGPGAVQEWIEVDESVDVIATAQTNDIRLRHMALFDILINNTDRKFGHLLIDNEGAIFGCDHGVTFHAQPKLRTVLWQFAGAPLLDKERELLNSFLDEFSLRTHRLTELISEVEISALKRRIEKLLNEAVFPYPSDEWPAVPWPPY